jgi:hypothetical protein
MAARTHIELKQAVRRLVRAVGGQVAAARITGVSRSQIQRYAAPNQTDDIGIGAVLALERAAKDMIVTGMLAQLQGAAVLSLPHGKADGVLAQYANAVAATLSASEAIAQAAARDPNIRRPDLLPLAREAHDVLSRWSDLLAAIHERMK